jgi:hypothetical protein
MKRSRKRTATGVFALAAATLLAFPGAALATDGSATVEQGQFTWGVPATIDFHGMLNGHAQVLADSQGLDISDLVGNGDGWHITLDVTQFTTGGGTPHTLALDAASDMSHTGVCDFGPDDCNLAEDSAVPVALVAGSGPTVIQSAIADSGMGTMTYTHVMNLAIPAVARAGTYSSTWTYSIATGP